MNNTLFDNFHISYIVGSLLITLILIYLLKKYVNEQKTKDLVLLSFGLLTFFLHISELWVQFLSGKEAVAVDNVLFTIYFCNLTMVLLLICGLIKDKSSKLFKYLAITTTYAAIIGATVSLFYPEYYLDGTSLDWHLTKSLLSHSVMLAGAFYLLGNGYFKIEKANTKVFGIGLLFFGLNGLIINTTFKVFNLPPPNSMYLQAPPLEELPMLTWYTGTILLILVVFIFTSLYEKVKKVNIELTECYI